MQQHNIQTISNNIKSYNITTTATEGSMLYTFNKATGTLTAYGGTIGTQNFSRQVNSQSACQKSTPRNKNFFCQVKDDQRKCRRTISKLNKNNLDSFANNQQTQAIRIV